MVGSLSSCFAMALMAAATLAACGSTVAPSPVSPRTSQAALPGPPSPSPASVDWSAVAHAIHIPTFAPGAPCPRSTGRQISPAFGIAFGDGPVYPVGLKDGRLPVTADNGLYRAKVLWVGAPLYPGPVLIRGARLGGPGQVRFATGDSVPTTEFRLLKPGATMPAEAARASSRSSSLRSSSPGIDLAACSWDR
jgi:hypothetical protein